MLDFPFRHWSAIPRQFPSTLQVANTNFLSARTFRIRRVFENFSFGFIFKGSGELIRNGVVIKLKSPCGYSIYPGEEIECGPTSADEAWDQLYFDYHPKYVSDIERMGLVASDDRTWPLADPANIWAMTEELCALSRRYSLRNAVDLVDRLCERIVVESKIRASEETPHQVVISRIIARVHKEPSQPFDLKETARLSGLSEASFRRHWSDMVGVSPRRYLERVRIQEGCRMLAETDLPIRTIATQIGFDDEFYFSRRFRAEMAMSPRTYRRSQKIQDLSPTNCPPD